MIDGYTVKVLRRFRCKKDVCDDTHYGLLYFKAVLYRTLRVNTVLCDALGVMCLAINMHLWAGMAVCDRSHPHTCGDLAAAVAVAELRHNVQLAPRGLL